MSNKRQKANEYAENQKEYLSLLKIEADTDLYNIIHVLLIKAFEAGMECEIGVIPLHKKTVLSLNEAALYLGISKSSLYKLTGSKAISHHKTGKLIYFKREDLDEWLLQNRIDKIKN